MMAEHFHVPDVRNAIRDSAWELASIRLLAVILQTVLRDSEWQVGPEMGGRLLHSVAEAYSLKLMR